MTREISADGTLVFQGIRVKLTPMMEQFIAAKDAHPDALLFFRMGDFYELFFDDARTAHQVLGLTLTSRNKGEADEVPMAGVPFRAADEYIRTLVDRGFRVAICDQLEDPAATTGIVRRGLTRIVTPGTLADLEPATSPRRRLLAATAAIPRRGGGIHEELGLAVVDVATGEFTVTEVMGIAGLSSELRRLAVAELLVAEQHTAYIRPAVERLGNLHVQVVDSDAFDEKIVVRQLALGPRDVGHLESAATFLSADRIRGFLDLAREHGFKNPRGPVSAVTAVVWYVTEVQRGVGRHIDALVPYRVEDYMVIDESTQANLELTETLRGARREGSLLGVLDETVTAAGGRRLHSWLTHPLLEKPRIDARLDAVDELLRRFTVRQTLRAQLGSTHDIERLTGRLATGRATPRDLVQLRATLQTVPHIAATLADAEAPLLCSHRDRLDACPDMATLIEAAIVDEPPATLADGGVVRPGYDAELDRVVDLARSGKDWLLRYEQEQRNATGISSLKVRYNRVFGYYIEITRANLQHAPEHYIRRQTLTNCERFYTPELKEYEEEVLGAEERRLAIEQRIFDDVRQRVADQLGRLRHTASQLATLDVLATLAQLAHDRDYCRPIMREDDTLIIRNGRHPVVERFIKDERFVPNDLDMNGQAARVQIITGPNMAGKSTVIRQAALIVLMAQAGAFVPAESAEIGLVDRIFSRVGASDNLALGQSTFMVEMTEAAHILHHATPRSLIVLDEVGRGTATYDGLSIAWAVAEHLHDKVGARVLFATHYHELTELSRLREGVVNYSVAVKEWQHDIIFLRKLVPGAANRSYGIQVARLAGVPSPVISRAEEILYNLEMNAYDARGRPSFAVHTEDGGPARDDELRPPDRAPQLALFVGPRADADHGQPQLAAGTTGASDALGSDEAAVLAELSGKQLDTTTPLQALNLLFKWQRRLKRR